MEQDNIAKLFENYHPELSSDYDFMQEVKSQMDKFEIVKSYASHTRRTNRLAIVIASVIGFITGVLSVFIYPYLTENIREIIVTIFSHPENLTGIVTVVNIILICTVVIVVTWVTYDITKWINNRKINSVKKEAILTKTA